MNRRRFLSLAGATAVAQPFALASEAKKTMKITGVETDVLRFPPGEIYYDAIHEFGAEGGSVVLRLQTDAGIVGWAECTFGTMTGAPEVLQAILQKELKSILIGKDPAFPKRLRSEMWKALEYAGVQGMNTFAISTLTRVVQQWQERGALRSQGRPDELAKALLSFFLGFIVQSALLGEISPKTIARGMDGLLMGTGTPKRKRAKKLSAS